MSRGKVKYFNDNKGWGIIQNLETQQDVYVHYSAINMDGYKTLKQGQEVLYEIARSENGPQADNVTLIN